MDRPTEIGFVAAGVGFAAAFLPWPATVADAAIEGVAPLVAALAGAALLGFGAVRYGLVGARAGALFGGAGGAALAVYALAVGLSAASIPLGPAVALLGGVAAAVAGARGASLAGAQVLAVARAAAIGLGGYLLVTIWASLLATARAAVGVESGPLVGSLRSDLALAAGALTATAALLALTGRDRSYVDLAVPDRRDLAYVAAGAAAIFLLLGGLSALFAVLGIPTTDHSLAPALRRNPGLLVVLVPAAFLLIGPAEELLFRNLVQKSLYEAFRPGAAVLLASAIFAVAHAPAYAGGTGRGGLALAATLGVVLALSLVLGVVYDRTRNLAAAALVHGVYDAVVFVMLALGVG
jgi:membrane protease YdiL (CAAX protease family)